MADKDFGVKRINLVGAAGTPTITSPTDLIINANKVAISTNATVGGSLGIGTVNPTSKLWVNGDGYFVGVITATKFSGQLDATSALGQSVGFATTATNLAGGSVGNVPYQSAPDTTQFVTNGVTGQVLISNGNAAPSWGNVSSASGSFGGITVKDENTQVGTGSSIVTLNFVGSNIQATATTGANGIATITIADNLVGTSLSISGISTFNTVRISSGIISSTTGTAVTFIGNLTGTASYATTAGIATNLANGATGSLPYQSSPGITTFLSASGTNNQVLLYDTDSNSPKWGSVSGAAGAGINVKDEDSTSISNIKTLNFRGDNIIAVSDTTNGISTITVSSNLVGTSLSISGISTLGTVSISSGIISSTTGTAVTFIGNLTGTASYATTAGIASAVKPNSVALGSDTTGDYVQSISGTTNQITVTGGTGEGSTPVISIPNNPTLPGTTVTIQNDLQVNRNLNVNGNITLGGTTAFLNVQQLLVSDPDLILGVRTDAFGNDVSNDTTANHGGIAIASTEGNPLVQIYNPGIGESTLPTYKKIMWFKSGTFAGLGTDAWLFNYAIGIGSTQFSAGTRLAAGSVQFTENDLAVVRNINATGVITATKFVGSVGFATTATNLANGATGSLPYQSSPGITSFLSSGSNNQVLLYDTGSNSPKWGSVSGAAGAFGGITVRDEGTTSLSNITTVDIFGSNITATSGGTGIASIRVSDTLVGTSLSISGISTLGTVSISSGIISSTTGTAVTFIGNLTGTASYATTAGIATNLANGSAGNIPYQSATNTTAFVTNGDPGQVLLSNGSGTPYWSNVSSASGSFGGITVKDEGNLVGTASSITTLNFVSSNLTVTATTGSNGIATITMSDNIVGTGLSISGSIGIGTTNPTSKLWVNGDGYFVGVLTANRIFSSTYGEFVGGSISGTNLVGTGLSISGISTLGTVQISSGIITATTGIVTYYGDGSKLSGINASGSVSISTNTTNQTQYLTYVTGTGSTTGFGITTTGLVFNPSTGNLGIGSTVPTSKLTVQGNVLISGVTTSGITRISSSTASPNASIPVATFEAVGSGSDYDIAIVPKGIGSIVARIPDGTSANGNKRGNYAVDLQLGRNGATQVASNHFAVIAGGQNNTANGQYTFVGGGYNNITGANSYSAVVGGSNNTTSGGGLSFIGGGDTNRAQTDYCVIAGGSNNTTSGQYASILGGVSNTASGGASFIGGGTGNTSGGTKTFVGAGEGNNTAGYSFGAIVGGQSNAITGGGYCFIGGGDSHIAGSDYATIVGGSDNTANGQTSFIGGGSKNAASATHAAVSGGNYNTASGNYSFIGGGQSNTANGSLSSIVGGEGNILQSGTDRCAILGGSWNNANGSHTSILCASYSRAFRKYSSVISGHWGDTRNTYGAVVFSGANDSFGTGYVPGGGYQQSRLVILSKATTDATPSTLTADGNTYDGDNVLSIPTTTAYLVKGSVIAYALYSGDGDTRAWEFTAAIKNTSGTPSLVGTPIINDIAYDSGASGWNLSITADASTSSLKVEVTGQASTTIRWVTKMDSTEVAFQ